jgi:hypothetical protein
MTYLYNIFLLVNIRARVKKRERVNRDISEKKCDSQVHGHMVSTHTCARKNEREVQIKCDDSYGKLVSKLMISYQ